MIAKNLVPDVGEKQVIDELLKGLRSEQKNISSKFFYDGVGSELYEEITKLEEYYPVNIEKRIIKRIVEETKIDFKDVGIVELGSGDCSKISILLSSLSKEIRKTITYIPVDISKEAIEKSSNLLRRMFPDLKIHGIAADFLEKLEHIPNGRKRVFVFFGSTIGNLSRNKANEFLSNLSKIMNKEDILILGMDMVKEIGVLEAAYNDKLGVTAKFNKNILKVVNRHLKTDIDSNDFEHFAFFNKKMDRIEMHLKAKKDIAISIPSTGEYILIAKGETIHTENSHKFTYESINLVAKKAGLAIQRIMNDDKKWFSLVQMAK